MVKAKRAMIWLMRLVRDREKWENHPAFKAWQPIKKPPPTEADEGTAGVPPPANHLTIFYEKKLIG